MLRNPRLLLKTDTKYVLASRYVQRKTELKFLFQENLSYMAFCPIKCSVTFVSDQKIAKYA